MRRQMRRMAVAALVLSALAVASCSGGLARVQPFEREHFAEDKMLFVPMASRAAFEEHVFGIREASQGGASSLQGGCGCK